MSAPARLLALRLQGFKSFGERTTVEFGPGISAVVGPNGAGKSNLADALRWTLGEQGRALRLRKSEDVIFAGSEKRAALGMADVTLVLMNSDRLLPIEFETVELGRRLFRSGENDYLLNRQRVRLKDLVDLLDAAHLADNAFLFIGQGMVDQALALRPEERRPLFEEVAGVHRHERRKVRAEAQLAEAEVNLARVEDVLAELRPQARRLADQVEQQVSRQSAGTEYGRAVIDAARHRWLEAAGREEEAVRRLAAGRSSLEGASASLREAEERAAEAGRALAHGAEAEAAGRAAHEAARAALVELRLLEARAAGEAAAAERDRLRLQTERAAVEQDLAEQRRALAGPVPERNFDLSAALAEAERGLAEALAELGAMRTAHRAEGEALAGLVRVEAARAAEEEAARRRLAEAEKELEAERTLAAQTRRRLAEAERAAADPGRQLAAAAGEEAAAEAARDSARLELDRIEGVRLEAADRAAVAGARAASLRGSLEILKLRLTEDESRAIARAARKVGGRPLAEGLDVEAGLRMAVEAALGEAMRGFVVGREAAAGLEGLRGVLVLSSDGAAAGGARAARAEGRVRAEEGDRAVQSAIGKGGGRLLDAVLSDPGGVAGRLLARCLWVPDIGAALAIQPQLEAGWIVVTAGGDVVRASGVVVFGRPESVLERRAEIERLTGELGRAEAESASAVAEVSELVSAAGSARAALDAAVDRERRASAVRRQAEEAGRRAARALESAAREAEWQSARVARAEADRARLVARLSTADRTGQPGASVAGGAEGETERSGIVGPAEASALREWEARVDVLRRRRDALADEEAGLEAERRRAEAGRERASAAIALDDRRIADLDRQAGDLETRERSLAEERKELAGRLGAVESREAGLRADLEAVRAAGTEARTRLAEAERSAARARERLRSCQDETRTAEVAQLEARLALDGIREQLLVELAGLGDLGLDLLAERTSPSTSAGPDTGLAGREPDETEAGSLEAALSLATASWAAGPEVEAPAPTRIATLRRRFHELGPPNPFATEEHRALRSRLDALEAQRSDLTLAISKTRALIEQLNGMISSQFRTTFAALETAFDGRFRQLFGGGYARLSLTAPDDLAATGVEIVARPPGKKAQPLSMLSGGERALTAVALLFAMLEVHPVPFCVLDEVDAALDEANIGRFVDALRDLAAATQFIVITHNRGTIECADALYGVTVGDDAVSRVVSLRLEEARDLADRVSGDRSAGRARGSEA